MGAPSFSSAEDFTNFVSKRLPGRRRRNRDKIEQTKSTTKRRIDAEIVKISAEGVMDIDFSETLHSFKHFEKFGLN